MILDKNLVLFDNTATGSGDSDSIDLGPDVAGPGEHINLYANGTGITAGTAIVVEDSADDSTFATLATYVVTPALLNAGWATGLPFATRRYIQISITAGAGGTVFAGVLKDVQTNT